MANDEELRRRLEILRNYLESDKIVIAQHLANDFESSLLAVKTGADGQIDLSTVDGRVRSIAMTVAMMKDRDDTKSAVTLVDIQEAYFRRVTAMFQQAHSLMLEYDADPHSFSSAMSRDTEHVEQNHPLIEPFVSELREFWQVMADPARFHLQDLNALKGIFGGDLFPSYERNIASSTGVYLDTIVLTDPFMNSQPLFPLWSKAEAVRMFLKHGLQLMNYRDLAVAELNPPIIAIMPFDSAHDNSYRDALFSSAGGKALRHAEIIFRKKFYETDELREFLLEFKDIEHFVSSLADPSRLLFDTEWRGDKASQIKRALQESALISGEHVGRMVFNQCFGRMSQATDLLWKSQSLGGIPLVDAPTSWKYFNWSLEYIAQFDVNKNTPLYVSRGMLRLAESEMQWIGNIPNDALIEIRKEGALEEIRSIISKGVDEVAALNPDNFFRSADKIYDNLETAFADHQSKIDALRAKKWKFATSDIGSWVVSGAVEVASAILGTPTLGLASVAVSQLTDAPKIKDIPKAMRDLKAEGEAITKSATGLLFKYRK